MYGTRSFYWEETILFIKNTISFRFENYWSVDNTNNNSKTDETRRWRRCTFFNVHGFQHKKFIWPHFAADKLFKININENRRISSRIPAINEEKDEFNEFQYMYWYSVYQERRHNLGQLTNFECTFQIVLFSINLSKI